MESDVCNEPGAEEADDHEPTERSFTGLAAEEETMTWVKLWFDKYLELEVDKTQAPTTDEPLGIV
jgi:hypothetical protein